jgi:hypothetical protein
MKIEDQDKAIAKGCMAVFFIKIKIKIKSTPPNISYLV